VHHPPHASSSVSGVVGTSGSRDEMLSVEAKFLAWEAAAALQTVEREMEAAARLVPTDVIAWVVAAVRDLAMARLAAKVLLVVLLEEGNREATVGWRRRPVKCFVYNLNQAQLLKYPCL
jgi:hypothetical protein